MRRTTQLLLLRLAGSVFPSYACVIDLDDPQDDESTDDAMSVTTSTMSDPETPGETTIGETTIGETTIGETTTSGSATDSGTDETTDTASDSTGAASASCCEERVTPGCDDPRVEACVCENVPECCDDAWSPICINIALGGCGATCETAPLNYACTCYEPSCDGVTAPSIGFALCSGGDAAEDAAARCVEILSTNCDEVSCTDCECFVDERFPECS